MEQPANNVFHRVIGIDLGTTYSAVASYSEMTMSTELLLNHADQNERTTPSVVSRDPVLGKAIVGRAAKRNGPNDPQNTIIEIKREMGEEFTPETLQKYNAAAVFGVGDPVKVFFDGVWLMPQEVSALILMRMKQVAEETIGGQILDAVVTVPAYFTEKQKKATRDAALLAGLYPRQLIPEPTAAAICYGVDQGDPDTKRYLVYDLGGGTFDVSIIEVSGLRIEVVATSGDRRLGGGDFDDAITRWAVEQLKQPPYDINVSGDRRALAIIKLKAEEAKIRLSDQATLRETAITLIELFPQNPPSLVLTQEKMGEIIAPFLTRSLTFVDEALNRAAEKGVQREDLSAILLVGGSSRLPHVRKLLLDYFRRDEAFVRADADPDAVVARGAAMLAHQFAASPPPFDIRRPVDNTLINTNVDDPVIIRPITEHSLGVRVQNDAFSRIVNCGSNIPVSRTEVYSNAGPTNFVEVQVFQGESKYIHENTMIGTLSLGPIEPREEGYHRFEVTFTLDVSGLLEVLVHHLNTGNKYSKRIEHKTGVTGIDAMAVMRERLLQLYAGTPPALAVPPPHPVVEPPVPPPAAPTGLEPTPGPRGGAQTPPAGDASARVSPVSAPEIPIEDLELLAPTAEVPAEFKRVVRRTQKQLEKMNDGALTLAFNAFIRALNEGKTGDQLEDLGDALEDAYDDAGRRSS